MANDNRRDSSADLEELRRATRKEPPRPAPAIPTEQGPHFKAAVPPQYPSKRMGKPLRREEEPVVSAPAHEETKPGGFDPAPGSAAPARARSLSPPSFASPAEVAAIEAMAESRGERVRRPPETRSARPTDDLSPEVIATAKALRAGGAALGKWLVGAVVTVVLGGGGALVGSQASNPVPPAVLQCPAELEQLRADLKSMRDRIGTAERDVDEQRAEQRRQARKHESLQSEVYEIGRRVPRVNP